MSKRDKLVGAGLGAGLAGAAFLALKYALRPPTKERVPSTISPAIFATKVLHTSLGTLIYHESGGGQPVVFVHGVMTGASSYEWSKVYPAFAISHRVLAPDLIGFGESSRPDRRLTAEDQVRSLAEFLRATCEQPAILVGSGIGGGFCVLLASQHPELVSRLVLLSPTGLREFGKTRLTLGTMLIGAFPLFGRFLYRNHRATRAAVRSMLEGMAFANPANITEETVDVYTTCAQQYGAEHAIMNLEAGRFCLPLEERLSMLTQPVALLWGERCVFPPAGWAAHLQTITKQSTLDIIPDTSVLPNLEAPAKVAQLLDSLLSPEIHVVHPG
jgi:pimeloyl-ACP methyl ester carboxylesterase